MEQLIIQFKNKSKAKSLIDFLKTLDFIKIIENEQKFKTKVNKKSYVSTVRGILEGSSVTSEKFAQSKTEEKKIENEQKSKSKVNYKSVIKSLRGSLKGSSLTSEKFAQYKVEEKKLER